VQTGDLLNVDLEHLHEVEGHHYKGDELGHKSEHQGDGEYDVLKEEIHFQKLQI